MHVYIFADLDDTLFQTLRKCGVPPECTPSTAKAFGLSVAAWSQDKKPMSFMTARQRGLLKLFPAARIIPVTARSQNAFNRVSLPFTHGAVLNYGGTVLLPDGNEDLAWKTHMTACMESFQPLLCEGASRLMAVSENSGVPVRIRIISTDVCNFYVVVKNVNPENCFLDTMRREGEAIFSPGTDWYIHQNDNNLAFIPKALNKAHAVRYFIEQYIAPLGDEYLTIGMGDSLVDIDFMNTCHYAMIPSGSQIGKVKMHE